MGIKYQDSPSLHQFAAQSPEVYIEHGKSSYVKSFLMVNLVLIDTY